MIIASRKTQTLWPLADSKVEFLYGFDIIYDKRFMNTVLAGF